MMHSHYYRGYHEDDAWMVLILVVMDDALAHSHMNYLLSNFKVLILVVMDDALAPL